MEKLVTALVVLLLVLVRYFKAMDLLPDIDVDRMP